MERKRRLVSMQVRQHLQLHLSALLLLAVLLLLHKRANPSNHATFLPAPPAERASRIESPRVSESTPAVSLLPMRQSHPSISPSHAKPPSSTPTPAEPPFQLAPRTEPSPSSRVAQETPNPSHLSLHPFASVHCALERRRVTGGDAVERCGTIPSFARPSSRVPFEASDVD